MSNLSQPLYERNQYLKPQINLSVSTAKRMWLVNFCAFITILQSSLSDSFSSMLIAVNAVAAALICEFIFLHRKGKASSLKDGSAVASALVLTLLLPNTISPFYAVIGSVFAIAVIKHSFGGLGSAWLNPAAGAWLFLRFSWPSLFTQDMHNNTLISSALDETVLPFLNENIFSLFSSRLPEAYLGFFSSPLNGIIADRGILALLIGTVLMLAFKAYRLWIPLLYLTVFCLLHQEDNFLGSGLYINLFSGGTFVAAFFLAAENGSTAKSSWGIFSLVIFGSLLAFVFRVHGGEFYGVIYGALFINALSPLVRILENRLLNGKWEKMRKLSYLHKTRDSGVFYD